MIQVESYPSQATGYPGKWDRVVNRLAIFVLAIGVLGFLSVPHMRALDARKEGMKLVELLEDYKVAHGTYPHSLDQLGVKMEFGSDGARGIRYRTYHQNTEFTLACFGRVPLTFFEVRDVYSSETKDWRTIRD